jgi:lysozyme family protein
VPQATLPVWRWDPRANRIIDQILQREVVPGGRESWNDPNAGPTRYGITRDGLAEWRSYAQRENLPGRDAMPREPYGVSRENAFRILKQAYYDQRGLADIEDETLASQLADMYVNHGFSGASVIAQKAIDGMMRRHGLYSRETPPFDKNDPVGPRTRARLNWLVGSGYGPELRNALVDERQATVRDSGKDPRRREAATDRPRRRIQGVAAPADFRRQ